MGGGVRQYLVAWTDRSGSGTSQQDTRRGVGDTHLLLVVIFDGIFIAFLQPGKRQAHLGGPPDLGARERDLKARGAPQSPPRECRPLSDARVHTRKGADPGQVSCPPRHPPQTWAG